MRVNGRIVIHVNETAITFLGLQRRMGGSQTRETWGDIGVPSSKAPVAA